MLIKGVRLAEQLVIALLAEPRLWESLNLGFGPKVPKEWHVQARKALIGYAQGGREGVLDRFDWECEDIRDHWRSVTFCFKMWPKGAKIAQRKLYPDDAFTRPRAVFRDVKKAVESVMSNPESAYRGMSFEEYAAAKKQGYIKSNCGYNLGDSQDDYTFFGSDFSTAKFYAGGFAPLQHASTRKKPGVIVEIPRSSVSQASKLTQSGPPVGTEHEYVTKAPIPTNQVRGVWFIVPVETSLGFLDVYWDKHENTYSEGSRGTPGNKYATIPQPLPGPIH